MCCLLATVLATTPAVPSTPFLRPLDALPLDALPLERRSRPYTSFGAVPALLRPLDAVRVPLHLLRCRSCAPTAPQRRSRAPTHPSVPFLRLLQPLDAVRVPLHLLWCRSCAPTAPQHHSRAPTPPLVPFLRSYGPSTPFARSYGPFAPFVCSYGPFDAAHTLLRPLDTVEHS
jgi:hypothetical protein